MERIDHLIQFLDVPTYNKDVKISYPLSNNEEAMTQLTRNNECSNSNYNVNDNDNNKNNNKKQNKKEQIQLNETYRLFLSASISCIISGPNISTKPCAYEISALH